MSLHSGAPERPRIIEEDERPGPPPLMSEERGKGRGLTILAAVLAVTAFSGVVWYAYDQGRRIGSETAAPLIKAEPSPSKVRPDSPGGMQIPHQDKLVLDDLGSGRGAQNGESRVERLLPPPETPVPAPEPLPAAPAPAVSGSEPQSVASAPVEAPKAPSAMAQIPPAKRPEEAASAPKALVPPPPPAPAPAGEKAPAPAPSAPKPAETAAAKPAPAPTTKAPAAGNYKIQIAALRNQDAAKREWTRVQSANKALLGALSPTFQRISTDNGVFFRVQGGPLTENAAKQACDALKAKGQACLVVRR
ncbi:SPOR domain-containing protein [Nisaea acidiphila]|uniref:SPOR domain-containing protein n=1 Tax=Nisaea acidiphila TaxID=1862145 RepID=A0A9J7ATA9_9PROT|nr:SPOR domain-containing protein [Nisaea acidiphila]UUX50090.1 SPOR domain-containing protein [Nisaea acidiphila]